MSKVQVNTKVSEQSPARNENARYSKRKLTNAQRVTIAVALIYQFGVIVTAVGVIVAAAFGSFDKLAKSSDKRSSILPVTSYEIIPHDSVPWQELIRKAKFRVYATAIVATHVDERELVQKVKNNEQFQAKLILLKPNGTFVGIRGDHETMLRNQRRIADKLLSFRELSEQSLSQQAKNRLTIKCIDVYPTISVFIIDHDLYVYFYPYRDKGTSSPVVVFRNFDDNTADSSNSAAFFERHFKAIDDEAESPTTPDYVEYKKLSEQK